MRTVNLKQRYWIALGAILGAAVGASREAATASDNQELRRPVSEQELVNSLTEMSPTAEPLVTDLIVFPKREGHNYITGFISTPTARGTVDKPFFSSTAAPLEFRSADGSLRRYSSIIPLLAESSARNSRLIYRYAWWRTPALTIGGWCAGCILFVGVLWPLAYRLIMGVDQSTPEVGLWELLRMNLGYGSPPNVVAQTPSFSVEGSNTEDDAAAAAVVAVAPAVSETKPIVLDTAVLPALTAEEEREKQYRGEFYPVAAPTKPVK